MKNLAAPLWPRRQLLQMGAALAVPGVLSMLVDDARAAPTAPIVPAPLPRLTLSGPPAMVSAPLIRMAQTNALADVAVQTSFVAWRDPDQLRAMVLGKKADLLAMPSNVAANLYNRGAGVSLLNISTWGALWLVTRDAQRQTLADFRGEEIAVPFRGDMPDLMLQLLATQQGIDPRREMQLRYVPTPMEAMQLLITRRVRHALLTEPGVSLALRKTQSFPVGLIAPELHRGADLQQEWGRLFSRSPRIPQAGIAAVGDVRSQPQVLAAVLRSYAQALTWCRTHPIECGHLMAQHIDLLTPEAVADALPHCQLDAVPAPQARGEVQFFFQQLLARDPAVLGGKMPDAGFFYDASAAAATTAVATTPVNAAHSAHPTHPAHFGTR